MQRRSARSFSLIRAGLGMAVVLVSVGSRAEVAAPSGPKWCGYESGGNLRPAHVVSSKRADFYFYSAELKGCPDSGSERCRESSYDSKLFVRPGAKLLVSAEIPGFICAYGSTSAGGVTGWMRRGDIALDLSNRTANSMPGDWVGDWGAKPVTLSIEGVGDTLSVVGKAQEPAGFYGYFRGSSHPVGRSLMVRYGPKLNPCEVRMNLVGTFLVVQDNGLCGGAAVSFSGIYSRTSEKVSPGRRQPWPWARLSNGFR